MEEQNGKQTMIPYCVYESMLSKEDTQQRRMIVVIILLIVLLVVTNVIWLVAWNQYEYVDDYGVDIQADGNGNANYIGNDGDINYGKDYDKKNEGKN